MSVGIGARWRERRGLLLSAGQGTGKIKIRKSHGLDDDGHKSVSQSASQSVGLIYHHNSDIKTRVYF
jgi:hypothetical protein